MRKNLFSLDKNTKMRNGVAPEINAILNSTVLGLLDRAGVSKVAEARREFDYHLSKRLITQAG
jgi:hypothetical protein